MPLGNLPEPVMIVLGGSKTRFVNVVFRYLEDLAVLLGFFLAPLGPILGPI